MKKLEVYWDNQDPKDTGWAYRLYVKNDLYWDIQENNPILGDDLDDAIAEACRVCNINATPDQFTKEPAIDGGFAEFVTDV